MRPDKWTKGKIRWVEAATGGKASLGAGNEEAVVELMKSTAGNALEGAGAPHAARQR